MKTRLARILDRELRAQLRNSLDGAARQLAVKQRARFLAWRTSKLRAGR